MFCRHCGRPMADYEVYCRSCGWTVSAPAPVAAAPSERNPLLMFQVLMVVAMLSGVVLGGIFAWRASSRPLFDILERESAFVGSEFTAWVTVENIGFGPGEVTVVCEVSFSDGRSFWDNETNELAPTEIWTAVLVVELPQAYVIDDSGAYSITLE